MDSINDRDMPWSYNKIIYALNGNNEQFFTRRARSQHKSKRAVLEKAG